MLELKADFKGLSSRAELWAAVIVACAGLAFTAVVVPHRALFGIVEFWLLVPTVLSGVGVLCLRLLKLYEPRQALPDAKDATEAQAKLIHALNERYNSMDPVVLALSSQMAASTKAIQELVLLLQKARQAQE